VTALADSSDALLLDLDGTVYLGGRVIPHVVDVLIQAAKRGARPMFVTNNASRPPAEVAAALNGMGVAAVDADVLTSPEAAASMLAESHPAGSRVLIVGAKALSDAVADAGLSPVRLAADDPVAVVQGHSSDTGWKDLAEACIAIRSGADWVASNTDTTLPTDRGLLPGNGAMVEALKVATGRIPRVAGKPNRPLLDEAVRRAGAKRPLVVGDRLDTDIEAAVLAGMPSLLVLTGVSTAADLLVAPASRRPTHVAFDLRGLIDENLVAEFSSASDVQPAAWSIETDGDVMVLGEGAGGSQTDDDARDLQALALLVARAWSDDLAKVRADGAPASAALARFGLKETSVREA
jgi:glycerol 3-phosphatase-2